MAIEFRYLNQEEVAQLGGLDMAATGQDMEEVFRLFGAGECVLPSKAILRWGDAESEHTRGHINAMPGYVGGGYDMAGIKWIACMYANPFQYGLPALSALTILNHPTQGFPVAVMDGTLISAMRTGAVAGVAAKYLAREDSRTVGIIGAGVQGRTALMAIKTVLPNLSHVLVNDIREERSAAFCEEMGRRLDMKAESVATGKEVVSRADVLVTAVSGADPVVRKGWVPGGCLYCQMGGGNECESSAVGEFDKIVADNWGEMQHRQTQVLAQAKIAGVISDEDIYAELGELVTGKRPGREAANERIFFGAVGMGIEDIAVATRILRRAEEEKVGTMLKLWDTPAFI